MEEIQSVPEAGSQAKGTPSEIRLQKADFREFDKLFFIKLKDKIENVDKSISKKIPILRVYNDFLPIA